MTSSTLLTLKNNQIIAEYLICATELIASSEKGYKEFRNEKGEVYRATDYDPKSKQRIQVPIRKKKENPIAGQLQKELRDAPSALRKSLNLLASGAELTGELITEVATDPDVRRRLGLAAGKSLGDALEKLNRITINNPALEQKLKDIFDGFGAELAKEFGDDQDPFAQAMRLGPSPSPKKNASLGDRLAFELAKSKILLHVIAEPEKYDARKAKREADLQRIEHAAINILLLVAIAAGPDVAYPLLSQLELPVLRAVMVKTEVHLMSIIKSWFIGAKVDELVFEPLVEKLDIENPTLNFLVRFALSMTMTHFFYKHGVEELLDHAGESLLHNIKKNVKPLTQNFAKVF